MARRLRIKDCGYHHIYNRGVAKSRIFKDDKDKDKFLEILNGISKKYKFNIHSFCLMDNHYHLLIENQKENLSNGMRQINSKYAIYFNKKYKRVGHLWQDRYKSWFIMSDEYLFTLFKYIESNPMKAKMSKNIGEYRYSSTYYILNNKIPIFLQNSFVLRDYDTKELFDSLNIPLNKKEKESIDKFHKMRYRVKDDKIEQMKKIDLKKHFTPIDTKNKQERNEAIMRAFEDDYSRSEIAREIGLSVTGVSKIIKKFKVGG